MKKQRMGHIWLILAILCALTMSGCGSNKTVEGSEKTYYGVVTDCAMSVVKEGDRTGRPYIIISTADGTEICFWMKKNHSSNAQIGDTVTIESAIERETNLLVATKVIVEESEIPKFQITVENATSEEVYGIGYAWYVNGDLQSSGGACYADNSAIKIGDLFSLDSQSYLEDTKNVEIELSVVSKSGKEYPCASRIGIDIETGTACEIKITGDYEDGFCASIIVGKSK